MEHADDLFATLVRGERVPSRPRQATGFPPEDVEGNESFVPIPSTMRGPGAPSAPGPSALSSQQRTPISLDPKTGPRPQRATPPVGLAARPQHRQPPDVAQRMRATRAGPRQLRTGVLLVLMILAAAAVATTVYLVLSRIT